MSLTPLLGITELEASQAQPEVTINTALRILEAMSPLQVLDRDLNTPPGSPIDGDRYLVAGAPTGAWTGHTDQIALNLNGTWTFLTPRAGWRAYVEDEDLFIQYVAGSPSGWA